jgi:hypothetical protein
MHFRIGYLRKLPFCDGIIQTLATRLIDLGTLSSNLTQAIRTYSSKGLAVKMHGGLRFRQHPASATTCVQARKRRRRRKGTGDLPLALRKSVL